MRPIRYPDWHKTRRTRKSAGICRRPPKRGRENDSSRLALTQTPHTGSPNDVLGFAPASHHGEVILAASRRSILVIMNDPVIAKLLTAKLNGAGYRAESAADVDSALEQAAQLPDLILFELAQADMGREKAWDCIRRWSTIPLVVIINEDHVGARTRVLDAGADDCISRPFAVEELLARVGAVLRRASNIETSEEPHVLVHRDLRIEFASRRVTVRGREIHLTPTEFDLLKALALNSGRVLTRRDLLIRVWGAESWEMSDYLRTHIKNLRHKIEVDSRNPEYIRTIVGVGYHCCSLRPEVPPRDGGLGGRHRSKGRNRQKVR